MRRVVLITPAHNEEAFIAKTADSVVAQTLRPVRWIVVNDASTDRTANIIGEYAARYDFIQLLNVNRPAGRHFGNKVRAFNAGLAQTQNVDFDFIGNLDADISFEADYLERIVSEFGKDSKLGVGGGMVHTRVGAGYVSQRVALDSVAGAVQLFRRKCFEQIGGYVAVPNGGIDAAAEISARMHGWRTCTFADCRVLEHRLTGSARSRPLISRVNEGRRMYALGYGLVFFLLRCAYRSLERPWVLGSFAALWGFVESRFRGCPMVLPPEAVRFLRSEQNRKLKRFLGWGSV